MIVSVCSDQIAAVALWLQWYHDSQRIYPHLASCMVAIDQAHSGNGCLNVLKGSHLLGRVDHSRQERGEMHADTDRVALAMEHCERVECELAPGSVPTPGNRIE